MLFWGGTMTMKIWNNALRTGASLCLCASSAILAAPAHAETAAQFAPYPERATDSSILLGGWLETRFARMVDACTDKKWDRKVSGFWSSAPVTVVPNRLSTRYVLTRSAIDPVREDRITRVFDLGSQSLPAFFARVRTALPAAAAEIDSNALPVGPGTAALKFADLPPELRLVSPHFNGSSYSSACATSISYAFDLSGGYSMPAAGVKAALSGSGSETTANALRIVEGVFYSPFAAMWLGTYGDYSDGSGSTSIKTLPADAAEPLKTHVALLFWRWYAANPGRADQNNGILEYFSGIAVQEENQAASRRGAEVSGEFAASLPVLSASLKGKFATSSSADFWSKDYFLAAFRDGRARHAGSHYMPLPRPVEISAHFASLKLLPWNGSDNLTIYDNTRVAISQYIYGMTAPHCASANWTITSPDGRSVAQPGLTRRRVAPAFDAQQVPICLVELDYMPTDQDVSKGATLNFALTHAQSVASAAGTVQLRLAGSPVTLKPYSRPDWRKLSPQAAVPIDPLNVSVPIIAGSHPTRLQWRVEYQFDPKGGSGRLIEDSVELEDVATQCANGDPLTMIDAKPVIETSSGLGKLLVVTLNAGVPPEANVFNPIGAPVCRVNVGLRYRLNVTGSPEIRTKLASAALLYPLTMSAPDTP